MTKNTDPLSDAHRANIVAVAKETTSSTKF